MRQRMVTRTTLVLVSPKGAIDIDDMTPPAPSVEDSPIFPPTIAHQTRPFTADEIAVIDAPLIDKENNHG